MDESRIIALDNKYGRRNPDLEKIQQAQDKYTRAETLKEVGVWLNDYKKTGHLNRTIIEYLIENLERGELPPVG